MTYACGASQVQHSMRRPALEGRKPARATHKEQRIGNSTGHNGVRDGRQARAQDDALEGAGQLERHKDDEEDHNNRPVQGEGPYVRTTAARPCGQQ